MEFRRLFELFSYQEQMFSQKIALAQKKGINWQTYSTRDCLAEINRVSAGLLELGVKKGEKIAIIAHIASPKWNFLDMGIQQIGAVVVPIPYNILNTQLTTILKEINARFCFVSNRETFQQIDAIKADLPLLQRIFTFDKLPDLPGWQDFTLEPQDKHLERFQHLRASIHEDDLATIVYTSGTTQAPKGVMLSHKNIISNIKGIIEIVPINCDKKVMSYLPLSYIFERVVTYMYIAVGATIYYPQEYRSLHEQLQLVKPQFFTAIPKTIENLYVDLLIKVESSSHFWKQLNRWAIRIGKKYQDKKRISLGYFIQLSLVNLLVFGYWRKYFGGKVEGIMTGAANLSPEIVKVLSAANIEIREGYGLTETSPVVCMNSFHPEGNRFSSLGLPIKEVSVKLRKEESEDIGEICVHGPGVMLGYYNKTEQTKRVLDEDGWFHTGDMAYLEDDQFLVMVGRKKNLSQIKDGTYFYPESIEKQLNASLFVYRSIVIGNQKPFLVALILPNFKMIKAWCEDMQVKWTASQFMILQPVIRELFQNEIDRINDQLPPSLQIKNFLLSYKKWEILEGEITPTTKPIRHRIIENYYSEIEKLYSKS